MLLMRYDPCDYSASNTKTTDNDVQFISVYKKLDETFHHNASGVTMSRTPTIVPIKGGQLL